MIPFCFEVAIKCWTTELHSANWTHSSHSSTDEARFDLKHSAAENECLPETVGLLSPLFSQIEAQQSCSGDFDSLFFLPPGLPLHCWVERGKGEVLRPPGASSSHHLTTFPLRATCQVWLEKWDRYIPISQSSCITAWCSWVPPTERQLDGRLPLYLMEPWLRCSIVTILHGKHSASVTFNLTDVLKSHCLTCTSV